jgi:hypothetical protein
MEKEVGCEVEEDGGTSGCGGVKGDVNGEEL